MLKNVHPSAAEAHAPGDVHVHVTPLPVYFGVFGALLVLTVITVGVSELGLPMPLSIIAALIVAVIKATLVCAFFMHLAFDVKAHTFILLMSLFFCFVFFTLTMVDLLTRADINPENGIHVRRDEDLKAGRPANGWVIAKEGAAAHGEHGEAAPASPAAPAEGAPAEAAPAAH